MLFTIKSTKRKLDGKKKKEVAEATSFIDSARTQLTITALKAEMMSGLLFN
tara:strand:- start:28628 stop:28780 length:153 start_codon:yes stop_codon:yes gene_type:complete